MTKPKQKRILLSHGAAATVDINCSEETIKLLEKMVKLAYKTK
jgi:hypothetical protein